MKRKDELAVMECESVSVNTEEADISVSEELVTSPENTVINKNGAKGTHKLPRVLSFGAGVPRGFCRGSKGRRGRGRTAHWHQRTRPPNVAKTHIEEVNMQELEEALPS